MRIYNILHDLLVEKRKKKKKASLLAKKIKEDIAHPNAKGLGEV